MLVFSNAQPGVLKETALVTTLNGSGGVGVTSMSAFCTVTTGTGVLFHDFSVANYGENTYSREQPVTLFDDTGWYEEAFIVARSGDVLTISRRAIGQEYGGGPSQVFPTLPIGTKIAPYASARTFNRFLQKSLPLKAGANNIRPDTGVSYYEQPIVALGQFATATKNWGAAVGPRARSMVYDALALGGFIIIAKDDDSRYAESGMSGAETIFSTVSLDLTGGIAWAPNTVFPHGTVFRSNPDNGLQWTLSCSSWGADQHEAESTTTEPSWSSFDYDYIDMDFTPVHSSEWAYMYSTDWETNGYDFWAEPGGIFYPTELIFICDRWDNVTTDAEVTMKIGSTFLVNNEAITGITGSNQRWSFPITANKGASFGDPGEEAIMIWLDTRATGDQMNGRFLIKGIYIENLSNPPLSNYTG
jgi:hypothetical protein